MSDILNRKVVAGKLIRLAYMLLGRREPIGMPSDCILHNKSKYTKVHKKGRGRWKDKDGRFYEWDALHGEIEIYNSKGEHIGVKNAQGNSIGGSVPGRKINVR